MLQELQLRMVPEVECLFMSKWLVIFFFVDDIVALFKPQHQPKFTEFMTHLTSKYELCDLGELKWFLGIRVVRDHTKKKLWLSQDSYVEKCCGPYRTTRSSASDR